MSEPEETDIYGGLPDYDFDKKLQEVGIPHILFSFKRILLTEPP